MDTSGRRSSRTRWTHAVLPALGALLAGLMLNPAVEAELANPEQMQQVCANWLARSVAHSGPWAGTLAPVISDEGIIEKDGVVLARFYNIDPDGFVIVPVLMELPPVKAYYHHGRLSASDTEGPVALLRDQLYAHYRAFEATYGSAAAVQPDDDGMYASRDRRLWTELAVPARDYRVDAAQAVDSAGPLTRSSWHQNSPYNLYCPTGQSGRTVVGCVATAASQILYYWQWPDAGFGSYSYFWDGDNSCGGSPVGAQVLSVDLSDPYDWASMVDSCDLGCNSAQQAALAELNYEVGVALEMDYGSCGSGASQARGLFVLPYHFKYDWSLELVCRKNYDVAGWFAVIKQEIDAGRLIWYGIHSHEIVADGYRTDGVTYEFHMNYGWGQGNNAWYVLDHLACSWVSGGVCPADMENMIINIKPQESAFLSYSGSLTEIEGDGDYYLEPGESVNIRAVIRNQGWDVTGASVTISSSDPYVTLSNATSSLGAMTHGQADTVDAPATALIDPSCPSSRLIQLTVELSEDGGFSASHPLQIRVGDTHGFADDAESGDGQWLHRPVVDRYNDQWHLDTYRRHAGNYAWKAGGPGLVEYEDGSDGGLITMPLLAAPGSKLTFWHRLASECGSTVGSAWDGGILMISDDGLNWTKLYPTGGYPKTTLETGSALNFEASDGLFAGQITTWSQATFDLSPFTGPVQLMFRFGSDGGATEEGWYVDDIWIGNTNEGVNVPVQVVADLEVKFGVVGAKGSTWTAVDESGPAPLPAAYGPVPASAPRFYRPSTSATCYGSTTFTFSYDEAGLTGDETDLVVMIYQNDTWQIVTSTLNAESNTISAVVTGLPPVVLTEKTTCCVGRVGDANMNGDDEPTIGDVSLLIDAKFITGSCDGILTCLPEADINLSGGDDPACDDISIGDITVLIDYLFITGQTLGLSPCP